MTTLGEQLFYQFDGDNDGRDWRLNGRAITGAELVRFAAEQRLRGGEFTPSRAAAYLRDRGYDVKYLP
jgi:hypothetical protein